MEGHGMYGRRAALYDRIYHYKPYDDEAERVAGLLAAEGVPDGSSVLEAACGTGSYLQPLKRHFEMSGLDLHPGMLDIARKKAGDDVRLIAADMRDFELDTPVDAIVCLFSSIGYLRPDGLDQALACFHRAVRPGGVVIIEPWIEPQNMRDRSPHLQTYHSPELHVARACVSELDGRVARMDFHWMVVSPDGIEHFTDVHEMWCSTREEMTAALESAGFTVRWEEEGLCPGRGLAIAVRPD
jgi:daunosaminyl-N,N-dimethyltransferase/N-dimethyltransferase